MRMHLRPRAYDRSAVGEGDERVEWLPCVLAEPPIALANERIDRLVSLGRSELRRADDKGTVGAESGAVLIDSPARALPEELEGRASGFY